MLKPNIAHAKRTEKTLRFQFGKDEDVRTMVIDMLANLRHVCDLRKLDFAELDGTAYDHYNEERNGNP